MRSLPARHTSESALTGQFVMNRVSGNDHAGGASLAREDGVLATRDDVVNDASIVN